MSRAILLVDHGSGFPSANDVLEQIAERVRQTRRAWIVEVAHMEIAPPTLAQGFERCAARGAREIVVCPYFLAPGRHSRDIPRLVAEMRAAYPDLEVAVAEPLGFDERLVDLVLDRVDAAIR